ncbi:MAG: hypothetical protein H6760_04200 [Candidatus Nomurabacteria bacterium]|nr:MAG: hypothetical protein H6760_04200 [Candidatus Nomurabacteria bacterium]
MSGFGISLTEYEIGFSSQDPWSFTDRLSRLGVMTTHGLIVGELSSGQGDAILWIDEASLSSVPIQWVVPKSAHTLHGVTTHIVEIPEDEIICFADPPKPIRAYGIDPGLL